MCNSIKIYPQLLDIQEIKTLKRDDLNELQITDPVYLGYEQRIIRTFSTDSLIKMQNNEKNLLHRDTMLWKYVEYIKSLCMTRDILFLISKGNSLDESSFYYIDRVMGDHSICYEIWSDVSKR